MRHIILFTMAGLPGAVGARAQSTRDFFPALEAQFIAKPY